MNYIIPQCKIQLLGFTLSSNSILVNNTWFSFCSFSETDMEIDVSEQNNIEHVSSIISMERSDIQPLNSSLPELRRSNRLVLMHFKQVKNNFFSFNYISIFSPVCRRRETRLTRISLIIVWLFMFCHIWKLIPTFYEIFYGEVNFAKLKWLKNINDISHVLIVLNSSVNFLIYVVF